MRETLINIVSVFHNFCSVTRFHGPSSKLYPPWKKNQQTIIVDLSFLYCLFRIPYSHECKNKSPFVVICYVPVFLLHLRYPYHPSMLSDSLTVHHIGVTQSQDEWNHYSVEDDNMIHWNVWRCIPFTFKYFTNLKALPHEYKNKLPRCITELM